MTQSTQAPSGPDDPAAVADDPPAAADGPTVVADGPTVVAEAEETVAAGSYAVVADVNVRSGPGTSYERVGRLSAGSRVAISCQVHGQTIVGPLGTSAIWDRVGSGRYVTDTYVRTGSDGYVAPRCY